MDSTGCIYIFRDKHTCIHMYVTTIKENETMNLNESEGVEGTYETRLGRGKLWDYIILTKKEPKFRFLGEMSKIGRAHV